MIITVHFNSLARAVAEARKYGANAGYDIVNARIQRDGRFVHDITSARQLTISRAQGKGWTLAVDVAGRVRPATHMRNRIAARIVDINSRRWR